MAAQLIRWNLIAASAVATVLALAGRPLSAALPQSTRAAGGPVMSWRACESAGVSDNRKCGTVRVFEDRSARRGRTIDLNVIVLPATTASRQGDPVFWLEGGPGGAATQAIGPVSRQYLSGLRAARDLVFVDDRGTGKSGPLRCGDIGETPSNLDGYFGKLFPSDLIRACRSSLERTADLTQYTTSIAMDDLDDVREALGYERVNLAGASYGTLDALVYIRQHAARVRSAFLVGVVTPDFRLPLPFARAAQNALDRLFEDCGADASCARAFPDLQTEFASVLGRFDRGPQSVTMIDPATQQQRSVVLERESYVEHLRAMLYSTTGARLVPFVVHRAFLGDFLPFERAAGMYNLGGPSTSRGLYFSVTCAEAAPFIHEADIVRDTAGTFLGDRRIRAHLAACAEWPHGDVPAAFTEPVRSATPVVFFSGDADGSTPPWIAADAVKYLTAGRQIIAAHSGHQIDGPCTWNLMTAFIKLASTASLDATCAGQFRRPPFAMSLPGAPLGADARTRLLLEPPR